MSDGRDRYERGPHAYASSSYAPGTVTAPVGRSRGVPKTILKSEWSDSVEKAKEAIMNAVFCRYQAGGDLHLHL